jgi:hypothetical protein
MIDILRDQLPERMLKLLVITKGDSRSLSIAIGAEQRLDAMNIILAQGKHKCPQ